MGQTQLIDKLRELGRNLWWTWQPNVIALFRELDPALWRRFDEIVFFDMQSLPKPMAIGKYFRAANALASMGPAALLLPGGPNGTESMGYLIPGGKLLSFPVAQIGAEDGLLLVMSPVKVLVFVAIGWAGIWLRRRRGR